MRSRRRAGAGFGVLATFAFILAVSAVKPSEATAGFAFTPPRTLSEVSAPSPQVVLDHQDRATVVWQAVSPDGELVLIQAVRLSAGVPSGPVQTLSSAPNFGDPEGCPCPRLAVDPQGQVTVAWQAFDGTNRLVQAVQLGTDGSPAGPVQTLSKLGEDTADHRLAVDSEGRATVAWTVLGSISRVESVRLHPTGIHEEGQTLSEPGLRSWMRDLAIDRQGRATVLWESESGVQSVRLDSDGAVGAVQTLSEEDAEGPRVAVDSQDRATIAWWHGAAANNEVKALRIGADGTPGPVRTLSAEGQDALDPAIAVDRQDRVTVAWEDFAHHRVHAVRLDADGQPGPVRLLSDPDRLAGDPQLAAAPGGTAVVVWAHPAAGSMFPIPTVMPGPGECLKGAFEPESDLVQAAFIGADGVPGPVHSVSRLGEQSGDPALAVDSSGRPTVAWSSFDGTYFCSDVQTRVQSSWAEEEIEPSSTVSQPEEAGPPSSTGTLRLGKMALARRERLVIRGSCVGDRGTTCSGRLRLIRTHRSGRLRRDTLTGAMVVARGRFHLPAGKRRTVLLHLSGPGKRLVMRAGPGDIRVRAEGPSVRRRIVSITAARRARPLLQIKRSIKDTANY